jgi:signal peptidase I
MADDTNPSPLPPNFPGYHTDPPAPPARPPVEYVTATPKAPAFSVADYGKGMLRWLLNVLIGAGVGGVIGFILNFVLHFLGYWEGSVWLITGCGLVVGAFFSRFIVHTLGLAPKRVNAPPPTGKAAAHSADDAPQPDGVREIVETIVFVVVLVLMLKSFAAEAFVIPTGSMAVTLLGDQKIAVCPQCGYHFPVNASQQVDPRGGRPDWVRGCTCPNCRERIRFVPHQDTRLFGLFTFRGPFFDPETHQERGGPNAPNEIVDPDANSGDRVLVSKFAYDLFETAPDREDVVVFKYPGDDAFPHTGPFLEGVAMNYIKRLVGLSRETIAIHIGKLYALSPDKGQQYDDLKDITDPVQRAELAKQLWQKKYMHVDEAINAFKGGDFQILRKSPENILAMRRIVYDNDHQAADLAGPQWERWTGRGGDPAWAPADAHGFRLAAPDDQVHWLGYRHILRDAGGFGANGQDDKQSSPQLITDFMGYNTWEAHHVPGQNWVGDLILDCDVQTDAAQGELTLELSKGVDRFRARWDLSTGVCTLLRVHDDKEEKLDSKPTSLKGGGTHSVRFANVDERLTVWVDEALPFGAGATYDAPKPEGATKENDLEPASVGVKGTAATVRGLKLWRDTYYTTGFYGGNPGLSDAPNSVDFGDPKTWEPLQHMPTRTMYIQPEHYLCMGDNSPESSDGRTWGAVPKRLLLGKALAVYWPADRFGRIR